jgi:uncharacterized membrane protein
MIASDAADYVLTAAILALSLVTFGMRAGGFWLMGHVPLTPRVQRALNVFPGAFLFAIVVPIIGHEGVPALLGVAAAVGAMMLRNDSFLALVAGMLAAAGARALLG